MKQTKLNYKEWIKTLTDLVHRRAANLLSEEKVSFSVRILGTVFIILSGTLLYLDKLLALFQIESSHTFGYSSFSNFIWAFTQSVAPIFMILGTYLKPYKMSYLVAVYCYGLQLVWIFSAEHSDDFLGYAFATGFCVVFVLLVFFMKVMIRKFDRKRDMDREFVDDAKDVLEILKTKVLEGSRI